MLVVNQEMVLLRSLSCQIEMPQDVINALTELTTLVDIEDNSNLTPSQVPMLLQGEMGRLKYDVFPQQLQSLIEMFLPVSSIAKVLGVSESTVKRRKHGFFIKQFYSNITDDELDNLVRSVKGRAPQVGVVCELIFNRYA